jgi:outer membrane protein
VTETTRAQVLLTVSGAYFNLLRARAVQQVADQTVSARRLVADQVSALAESKLKSTLDVSFANVNLSEALLLQVQARNEVKSAEADLAAALGLPNETAFDLDGPAMPAPLSDRIDDLLRTALANRPEIKESRLQESAALRLRMAEHAAYFPTVSMIGTAGFAPKAVDEVPNRFGAIGLNISVPIFNGGLTGARTAEAEMKAKAAAENTKDLENRVIRDVRVAWLNATTAYDRLSLTKQLQDQAQMALDLAQTRYDLGLGSIVELSQAQLTLTSAQIANTSAVYAYQALRVAVDYQTGTLR